MDAAKATQGQSHLPGIFDVTPSIKNNQLFYGDNLTIMRNMPSASVDLIYLDPPFNSQRNYNLIYTKITGQSLPEQEVAFCDAWEMDAEKEDLARKLPLAFQEYGADKDLVLFWQTWINALRHTQPRLLAYLIYMSYRLFEMKRVLKPTGSIYLHCDTTASHYIKVIMDGIFGHQCFRNEIIWQRSSAHNDAKQGGKQYGRIHDIILFYSRGDSWNWNPIYLPYDADYVESEYRHFGSNGRSYKETDVTAAKPGGDTSFDWSVKRPKKKGSRWEADLDEEFRTPLSDWEYKMVKPYNGRYWAYSKQNLQAFAKQGLLIHRSTGMPRLKQFVDEMQGVTLQDIWTDISPIGAQAKERLGYPTQKPISLLKRIVEASSSEGEVVFDPFCGCGTSIYAAHELGRHWIGCDIAILSVRLVRDVLFKRYGLKEHEHYEISGIPVSLEGAKDLFDRDPRQFQHWSIELAGGFSSMKTSGDQGIDGHIYYETSSSLRSMVISVKGGKLTPSFVRELRGVIEREPNVTMGGFICLQEPTKGMLAEAAAAGNYKYLGVDYPKLQIRTVQELLDGRGFDTPSKIQTLQWIKQLALPL